MWDLVEYLKQPSLVAQIQGQFGIKDKSNNNKKGIGVVNEEKACSKLENNDAKNSKNLTDLIEHEYIIENKFWYYLFLIGTSLGDEIFYASFIPFWFWNIDGAVGRRVVFVWTIVMYVGKNIIY